MINKKIASELAVGVIIIVALVIGVIFYCQTKSTVISSQQTEYNQAKVKKNIKPTANNAVVDETADWQTYTNTKYGFEFKYPKNWNVTEDTAGDMPKITGFSVSSSEGILFWVVLAESTMDPKGWYLDGDDVEYEKIHMKNKINYQQLTINGYPAFYVSKEVPQAYLDLEYAISNNKGMIMLVSFREKGDWTKEKNDYTYSYDNYLPDFNGLVNSIKFFQP